MFRQFASLAALAIVASPMLPLANQAAFATQPHNGGQQKNCVQVRLDSYNYRGEFQESNHYWDRLYFDWHVDCYNQDKPPYDVYVKAYYEDGYSYSESYRGNDSDYTFKIRKPKKYAGKKPKYVEIRIVVVGNQGRYQYYNPRLTF